MKSCFDGFLTPECHGCDFWEDGSNKSIGCSYPGPIDHCEAFKKEWEASQNLEERQ